jgi:hypothetical protein
MEGLRLKVTPRGYGEHFPLTKAAGQGRSDPRRRQKDQRWKVQAAEQGLGAGGGDLEYYFINSTKGSERPSVCMRANAEKKVKKVERLRQAKATSLRKLRLARSLLQRSHRLKSKVGHIMAKATTLRVNLNLASSVPSAPRPPARKSNAQLIYALNFDCGWESFGNRTAKTRSRGTVYVADFLY